MSSSTPWRRRCPSGRAWWALPPRSAGPTRGPSRCRERRPARPRSQTCSSSRIGSTCCRPRRRSCRVRSRHCAPTHRTRSSYTATRTPPWSSTTTPPARCCCRRWSQGSCGTGATRRATCTAARSAAARRCSRRAASSSTRSSSAASTCASSSSRRRASSRPLPCRTTLRPTARTPYSQVASSCLPSSARRRGTRSFVTSSVGCWTGTRAASRRSTRATRISWAPACCCGPSTPWARSIGRCGRRCTRTTSPPTRSDGAWARRTAKAAAVTSSSTISSRGRYPSGRMPWAQTPARATCAPRATAGGAGEHDARSSFVIVVERERERFYSRK
mmetsp:Transcript_65/g.166  ORF Transcript_65/g.166 Transcript_65/m.166 type:complete len:331 (-) Transcript_65:29-1021(-)